MGFSSVANARLAGGGDRVVWGAGLFALGGFAGWVGLTGALSAAVLGRGEWAPVHGRGVLLVHLLSVLAGGGGVRRYRASAFSAGAIRGGGVALDAVSGAARRRRLGAGRVVGGRGGLAR
ncbi:hypothetical protein [Candidatus Poriferisodalis sp.]|uniref:hypothetical protein n=1 Tax=Candidatus Poriferisodalis sp. TaxID=3101277 RepID=UPI003B029E50